MPLVLLNLGDELTQPELFTELADILKVLRAGKARFSLDSSKIFKPGSE